MKTGKITAKLRDAVVIRLFEEGEERKQYKNIELPDALKELKMKDFEFDVPCSTSQSESQYCQGKNSGPYLPGKLFYPASGS